MLKISIVDSHTQRRLILEGRLIAPWVAELRTVWKEAKEELDGRELMIDMGNVMVVSQEAENTLLQMMNEGARFRCSGVLTKHVLQQLRQRCRKRPVRRDADDQKGQI
jgi:argininosuccinate synthase